MKDNRLLKLLAAAMLAIAMVFTLAACGSSDTAEQTSEPAAEVAADVSPELKELLDDYEAWVDHYCDFVETYSTSDNKMENLTELTELLKEEADWAEKIEALNEDEFTNDDLDYYLEVTLRCEKRLLEASEKIE